MNNLILALLAVTFAVVLVFAGVNYLERVSATRVTVATNSVADVEQMTNDYQNLRINLGHRPTGSDYNSVYGTNSPNSSYFAGNVTYPVRPASLMGAVALDGNVNKAGWTYSANCGSSASPTDCFYLKIDPSTISTTEAALGYQAAQLAATKETNGVAAGTNTSQITYYPPGSGCSTTSTCTGGSNNPAAWPATVPTAPYYLSVALSTVTAAETGPTIIDPNCGCTYGDSSYACGQTWTAITASPYACPSGATGTEYDDTTSTPYICAGNNNPLPNGTGTPTYLTDYCSECSATVGQCIYGLINGMVGTSGNSLTWLCTSTNGQTTATMCSYTCPGGTTAYQGQCMPDAQCNDASIGGCGPTAPIAASASPAPSQTGLITIGWSCTEPYGPVASGCSYSCPVGYVASGGACVPSLGVCNNSAINGCAANDTAGAEGTGDTLTAVKWNCTGPNGGTTVGCAFTCPSGQIASGDACVPSIGVCNDATIGGCAANDTSSAVGSTDTPTSVGWVCTGPNNGTQVGCAYTCPGNEIAVGGTCQCPVNTTVVTYGPGPMCTPSCVASPPSDGGALSAAPACNPYCPTGYTLDATTYACIQNGVVNTATEGGYFPSTPPAGQSILCSAGTASAVSGPTGNEYTWTCNGIGNGSTGASGMAYQYYSESCEAAGIGNNGGGDTVYYISATNWVSATGCCKPGMTTAQTDSLNGVTIPGCDTPAACGPDNGVQDGSAPWSTNPAGLCSYGGAGDGSFANNTWTWSCNEDGVKAWCSAHQYDTATCQQGGLGGNGTIYSGPNGFSTWSSAPGCCMPGQISTGSFAAYSGVMVPGCDVPPACGSAVSASAVGSAPAAGLCSAGAPSAVTQSGWSYGWTCSQDGTVLQCSTPSCYESGSFSQSCTAAGLGGNGTVYESYTQNGCGPTGSNPPGNYSVTYTSAPGCCIDHVPDNQQVDVNGASIPGCDGPASCSAGGLDNINNSMPGTIWSDGPTWSSTPGCCAPQVDNGHYYTTGYNINVQGCCPANTASTDYDPANNCAESCNGGYTMVNGTCQLIVTGVCGTNVAADTNPPWTDGNASSLCSTGTLDTTKYYGLFDADNNSAWAYICIGVNGGGDSPQCLSSRVTSGACGSDVTQSYTAWNNNQVNYFGLCNDSALASGAGGGSAQSGFTWQCVGYNNPNSVANCQSQVGSSCPTPPANGTYSAAPQCTLTCNTGYTLSNGQCLADCPPNTSTVSYGVFPSCTPTCVNSAPANGTISAAPSCTRSCNSGYTMNSSGVCVATNGCGADNGQYIYYPVATPMTYEGPTQLCANGYSASSVTAYGPGKGPGENATITRQWDWTCTDGSLLSSCEMEGEDLCGADGTHTGPHKC